MRSRLQLLLILIGAQILIVAFSVSAKDSKEPKDSLSLSGYYLKKTGKDAIELLISPVRWRGDDWMRFGAIAATTGGLMLIDEPARNWMLDHRREGLYNFSKDVMAPWGTEYLYKNYSILTLGAFYLHGALSKNQYSKHTALLGLESFILASVSARVIKIVAGRERPNFARTIDATDWNGPGGGSAFVSGHTTAIFSIATVIAERYKDSKLIPWLAYSFAGLEGLSRMYENKHWSSDVFAGAALGYAIGKFVTKEEGDRPNRTAVFPIVSKNFTGVRLCWQPR